MYSKGADVDALRDSAGRMASFGNEVDVVRAHGRRAVSTMQRAWQGPDLQHLLERWRRVEHDLVRISADFDRLSRRLHDNADLQHRSSGGPGPGHASGHPSGHAAGHPVGRSSPSGHASSGQVSPAWAAPAAAFVVAAAGTPQAHLAMGWAQWIGSGQTFGLQHGVPAGFFHPVPSAATAAGAAHQLGLPIR